MSSSSFYIRQINIIFSDDIFSLEEFFHGVNFKEMFIFSKFVGESTISFGKYRGLSSISRSVEFNSKDGNGIKSVLVFLKLLDEKLVGFTSGNVELDELFGNGVKSIMNPFEMI